MSQQIDTTNPNTITYITEELGFTILFPGRVSPPSPAAKQDTADE